MLVELTPELDAKVAELKEKKSWPQVALELGLSEQQCRRARTRHWKRFSPQSKRKEPEQPPTPKTEQPKPVDGDWRASAEAERKEVIERRRAAAAACDWEGVKALKGLLAEITMALARDAAGQAPEALTSTVDRKAMLLRLREERARLLGEPEDEEAPKLELVKPQ